MKPRNLKLLRKTEGNDLLNTTTLCQAANLRDVQHHANDSPKDGQVQGRWPNGTGCYRRIGTHYTSSKGRVQLRPQVTDGFSRVKKDILKTQGGGNKLAPPLQHNGGCSTETTND